MTKIIDCPVCDNGKLHELMEKIQVQYSGQSELRDSFYSVCDSCGSEQSTAEQLRRNKRDTIVFRKQVDGFLTGSDVLALREKLGINQREAALIFGGGPVAFSKYENDDVMQSESMDKLLRLASDIPGAFEKLAHDAGLQIKSKSREVEQKWETVHFEGNVISLASRSTPPKLTVVQTYESINDSERQYAL